MNENNDEKTQFLLESRRTAWEKWINGAGQEYLDMNRVVSVSQIRMFLQSAVKAGFEANNKAYHAEVKRLEKRCQDDLEFINKMTMKK